MKECLLARIIAVANQKGGVGKTTTALNLAACLAAKNIKTMLVDMDPQSNATSGLGIESEKTAGKTIYELLLNETTIQDILVQGPLDDLFVVPSTRKLVGAEVELLGFDHRDTILKEALLPIQPDFRYIIIDCPPSLNILTLNALGCADSVIIPVQSEYYALEGISALMETIELVRTCLNPDLQIEGVVMTMFNSRANLSALVHAEINNYFGDKVFSTIIPRNIRLSEAPSHGRPIICYDRRSKGAVAYCALAEEIIRRET